MLEEVQALAVAGYQEVVLTGIHLSSYGIDNGEDLLSLILAVHEVEGIRRIRLDHWNPGSSPKNLSGPFPTSENVPAFSSFSPERLHGDAEADEPALHGGGIF